MNRTEIIKTQLAIAQTAIDAVFLMLEEEVGPTKCLRDDPNSHPEETRKNLSTMGKTRWQCELCGFLFEENNQEEVT